MMLGRHRLLFFITSFVVLSGCTNTTTFEQMMAALEQKKEPAITAERLQPAYAPIDPAALQIIQESKTLPELTQDLGGGISQSMQIAPSVTGNASLSQNYYSNFTHKALPDYVAQLMMLLADQTSPAIRHANIALGHFVYSEAERTNTHAMGHQLLEYILVEGQRAGLGMVDLDLQSVPQKDNETRLFFTPSDAMHLEDVPFDHILTGTLVERTQGLQINARIVERHSNRVKAAAQVNVPSFIVDQVLP